MEISRLKITITEAQNLVNILNSRIERTKESVSWKIEQWKLINLSNREKKI